MGDKGSSQSHPSDDTGAQEPSSAPVGVLEVCGRGSRKKEEQKRTKLVLERWPHSTDPKMDPAGGLGPSNSPEEEPGGAEKKEGLPRKIVTPRGRNRRGPKK